MLCGANVGRAQSLPPGVQDVVKLAQAGISDDVILTQIKDNGANYNLTADQIIYLKEKGVSQPVIKALVASGTAAPVVSAVPAAQPAPAPAPAVAPAPAPAPTAAAAPAAVPPPAPAPAAPPVPAAQPAVSLDSFQAQLTPYGSWIQVPGYGLCWQPTVAVTDPAWRPYFDQGHWDYTDAGWSWESDYPWGGVVFHYGRWCRFNGAWVWVPGYDWAPAWVCWRQADGYSGWAALPPAAVYKPGVGLYFNGAVALDVDFGLGVDDFMFVGYDHFWDHNLRPFFLPHDRLVVVFRGSLVLNGYRMDHGRFIIEGLGRDHIATLTHHDVRIGVDIHDSHVQGRVDAGGHGGHDDPGHGRGW